LGEVKAALVGAAAQRALDAAVLVPERDFQMYDPLAVAVEAEMARLDDPGMHRPDGHLMDLGAVNREELGIADRWAAGREAYRLQPGVASRLDAVLLVNLALEMMRRRALRGEGGITGGDRGRTELDVAARIVGYRSQKLQPIGFIWQPDQQQQPAAGRDAGEHRPAKCLDLEHGNGRDRQRHGIPDGGERHRAQPPSTAAALASAVASE